MGYLLDLIIIAVIALITFLGYKKGIIKVAFNLISFVLAILLSIVLYRPISNFVINHTPLYDKIEDTIEERLSSSNTTKEEAENILANYYSTGKEAAINTISENVSI